MSLVSVLTMLRADGRAPERADSRALNMAVAAAPRALWQSPLERELSPPSSAPRRPRALVGGSAGIESMGTAALPPDAEGKPSRVGADADAGRDRLAASPAAVSVTSTAAAEDGLRGERQDVQKGVAGISFSSAQSVS